MVRHSPALKDSTLSLVEKLIVEILMDSASINHLISHLIRHFSSQELQPLVLKITERLVQVAYDHNGHQNLMLLVKSAPRELLMSSLVSQLQRDTILSLLTFVNGSILMQYFVSADQSSAQNLISKLEDCFLTISMNTYGSYFVSKCLDHCEYNTCRKIIAELAPSFSFLILHPCANFVIQSVIRRQWKTRVQLHPELSRVIDIKRKELSHCSIGLGVLATLKAGPVVYRSWTVFEDATADIIVSDFFWDCVFRLKWDLMLAYFKTLEEYPQTGTKIVHWIKKFPFFCR